MMGCVRFLGPGFRRGDEGAGWAGTGTRPYMVVDWE